MACLWQAYPEFTNMEIFAAVERSANRYDNPDSRFGYGTPNFRKAYQELGVLRDEKRKDSILKTDWIKAYPVPVGNGGFKVLLKAPASGRAILRLVNVIGQVVNVKQLDITSGQLYFIDYPVPLLRGVFYLHYNDGTNKYTLPVIQ
jgi:hypothetical protein